MIEKPVTSLARLLAILNSLPSKNLKECRDYLKFLDWFATPIALRKCKTQREYAKSMKVRPVALTAWRKKIKAIRKKNKRENKNQK